MDDTEEPDDDLCETCHEEKDQCKCFTCYQCHNTYPYDSPMFLGTDADNDDWCTNCETWCNTCSTISRTCDCVECQGCGWSCPNDELEQADSGAYYCPDCMPYCEHCGSFGHHDCRRGFGTITNPGWVERGHDLVPERVSGEWLEVWGLDHQMQSPATTMADFYLLEALAHAIPNPVALDGTQTDRLDATIRIARRQLHQLCTTWAPILGRYLDMVIGGEIRHHHAIADNLPYKPERGESWAAWRGIRDRVGPDALLDAAELCMNVEGGSYLGRPWATACHVVHAYVTGKLTDWMFLDRVFTLAHNSATMFDKIGWACPQPDYCRTHIGPAHAAHPPNWEVMLQYATPDVRHLFAEQWREANRTRIRQQSSPIPYLEHEPRRPTWTCSGTGNEPTNDPASTVSSTSMTTPDGTTTSTSTTSSDSTTGTTVSQFQISTAPTSSSLTLSQPR